MGKRLQKLFVISLVILCSLWGMNGCETVHAAGVGSVTDLQDEIDFQKSVGIVSKQEIMADGASEITTSNAGIMAFSDLFVADEALTSISSSELDTPQHWHLDISGMDLEVRFYDENVVDGVYTMVQISDKTETELCSEWDTMYYGNNTIEMDLSGYEDGIYIVSLWQGRELGYRVSWLANYEIRIVNGTASFVPSAYASEEQSFIEQLNAEYDPEDYNNVPYKYYPYANTYFSTDNLQAIIEKAKEITAGCTTDEKKVRKIHDWVCRNFAYDMESYYNNTTSSAASAEWVFENKRAVCSGFSRMCQIMFTAVGVPCMNVIGYSDGYGLSADGNYTGSNHEWNVVYLNGSWRNMDVTWDCLNVYMGSYSGRTQNGYTYDETVLNEEPQYTFYGTSPQNYGATHISQKVYADTYVNEIVFQTEPKTIAFEVGDAFVCDAVIKYQVSTGNKGKIAIKGFEELCCSGYDMNMEGVQMVTISCFGCSLTYSIMVGDTAEIVHTAGEWETVKEAGCVTDGLRQIRCTKCNEVLEEEVIPAIGHQGGVATCLNQAVCEHCGESYGELEEHVSSDWILEWNDDGKTGRYYKECVVCHLVLEAEIISYEGNKIPVTTEPPIDTTENGGTTQQQNPGYSVEGTTEYPTEATTEKITTERPTEATTEKITTEGPTETTTEKVTPERPTETTTEKITTERPTEATTEKITTERPTEATTEKITTEGPTETTTEKATPEYPTEATTEKATPERPTEATTEKVTTEHSTEAVTKQPTVSEKISDPYKVGTVTKVGNDLYKITSNKKNAMTVAYVGIVSNKKNTITSVKIPETVKIGDQIFKVTEITAGALKNNKKLKQVVIGAGVTRIGSKAFYGCKNLKNISIKSKGLTTKKVGSNAFKGISSKAKIKVPKSKMKAYKSMLKKKGASSKVSVKKL